MGRIEKRFDQLKAKGAKAFMPFVTACDPSPETTVEIVSALEDSGADIIELGFAYSDPIADGPVIQDSYAKVLESRRTVDDALSVAEGIRKRSSIPLAAMVSYSIVWKRKPAEFAAAAARAGIDALIIPDLPPEEAGDMFDALQSSPLGVVFLVTPNTDARRLERIVAASRPFIYYVSVVGTTGARIQLPGDLSAGVRKVKSLTDKPVVVGFGVSTPAQAASVAQIADGVIVGSALVRVISEHRRDGSRAIVDAVRAFAGPMAEAVKG